MRGFLLLELVVLVGIIAFLFCLAIPSFSCFEKARVRCDVEKLAAQIQYLQGLAVMTGQLQELSVQNSTFHQNKITCHPSGVVCAGTVYVTDKQRRYYYALSIPVGGYYRYIREQDSQFYL